MILNAVLSFWFSVLSAWRTLRRTSCCYTYLLPARKKSSALAEGVALPAEPKPQSSPRPVLGITDGRRIFLIDAMSFIFRAYHAMARQRGMSTKIGLPTAATYVFVNMLRKLRDDFSPEYLAAVFDVAAPTFRDQQAGQITTVRRFDLKTQTFQEIEYRGYKANRSEMRGDSIDNIPGAPGIGEKGSVELIKRFGTVEAALDRAAEVERRTYRESLQNNREAVVISKKLATIDCDVPIGLDVDAMKAGEPDIQALRALFTELEFTSLLKDLLPVVEVAEGDDREAKSAADIEAELSALPPGGVLAVAVDSEAQPQSKLEDEAEEAEEEMLPLSTTVTAPKPARCIAISAAAGKALTILAEGDGAASRLRDALSDEKLPKAIHDFKAAIHSLAEQRGIELRNVQHDPMLYSYLLDPTYSSHRLPDVALRRFSLKLSGNVAESADVTGRLASTLRREVEECGLLNVYHDIDLPLVPVLARMEQAGVKIDRKALSAMSSRLEHEVEIKSREIYQHAGCEFNINSPRQLGDVLFNKLNLPKPVKYGKGKTISTAVDVLEVLAATHEVPRLVLEYRQLAKLKSTYVDALPALLNSTTGRLHTTFSQTGTATGRLSSASPNLQNIPIRTELGREIRAAFTAEPGHVILAADYSQIELRLLAHFSKDPLLVEAYRRGDDIHTLTASQVFGVPPLMVTPDHRRQAKVVNFGIVYGLSPFGLSQNLGIVTAEAKRFIDAYFEKYSGVRKFIDKTLDEARREQKVKTLFGRVRPIPDINSKNANLRGFAERTAVNTPLQGTAADLIKMAMIRIDAAIIEGGLKSRMTLQVHDELVFEVPEEESDVMRTLVREQMENVHPLTVPLLVEIGVGRNWRDQA